MESGVQRLPFGMYAKFRGTIDTAEVAATEFVRQNTTVQVPRILDVIKEKDGKLFVVMSRLKGEPLSGRLQRMEQQSRIQFAADLSDWLHQLRRFPPPSDAVSDFLGGPTLQFNVEIFKKVGPWTSIGDFHSYLLESVSTSSPFQKICHKSFEKPHRLVLTHGDLSPSNILIDEKDRLCGIVDFGSCGWLPEYWDYVTAMCCRDQVYPEWVEAFRTIFPGYDDDLEAQKL
ncbi:hypothetical protein FRC16_007286, partial [Serendipita sp. 398]